jgi:hypothetical protein
MGSARTIAEPTTDHFTDFQQLLPTAGFFNSNLNRALTQWSLANLGFLDQGSKPSTAATGFNVANFL